MNDSFFYEIWCRIKDFIGSIAWRIFLWSAGMTAEKYRDTIYEQEKAYKEGRLYRTEEVEN